MLAVPGWFNSQGQVWTILVVALLLRSLFFVGFGLGDDVGYLLRIHEILAGGYPPLDPLNQYAYRPFLLYLFSGGVALFGRTDFGVVAPVLACSLITTVVVYAFVRTLVEPRAAWWCALLYAFEPFTVINSTTMTNDVVLTCLTFGALTLFLQADQRALPTWGGWRAPVSGLLMVAAFLTKITMFPALVAFGLYSTARLVSEGWSAVQRHAPFYLTFLAGMAAICLAYYMKTGDPFWQFRAEMQYYDTYKPEWFLAGQIDYSHLMWQYPRSLFGFSGYDAFRYRDHGWLMWLFLPASVFVMRHSRGIVLRFLVGFVCIVFGFFEFYPQYLTPAYLPLVRQDRYLEMLVPSVAIVVGWGLYQLARKHQLVAGVLLCVVLADSVWQASLRSTLYNDSQQDLRELGRYAKQTIAPTGKHLALDFPARNAVGFYLGDTQALLEPMVQANILNYSSGYIAVGGARSFWWSRELTLRMPRESVPANWILTYEVPARPQPWRESTLRVYYVVP